MICTRPGLDVGVVAGEGEPRLLHPRVGDPVVEVATRRRGREVEIAKLLAQQLAHLDDVGDAQPRSPSPRRPFAGRPLDSSRCVGARGSARGRRSALEPARRSRRGTWRWLGRRARSGETTRKNSRTGWPSAAPNVDAAAAATADRDHPAVEARQLAVRDRHARCRSPVEPQLLALEQLGVEVVGARTGALAAPGARRARAAPARGFPRRRR